MARGKSAKTAERLRDRRGHHSLSQDTASRKQAGLPLPGDVLPAAASSSGY